MPVNDQGVQLVVITSDGHPIVYGASGSHGLWPTADGQNYKTLSTGDKLNDYPGTGKLWET